MILNKDERILKYNNGLNGVGIVLLIIIIIIIIKRKSLQLQQYPIVEKHYNPKARMISVQDILFLLIW